MKAIRAYLELVRLPNLLTAAADVWAGFAYAGGGMADGWTLVWLSLSSMSLYAGGVALNDACDAAIDAGERPERPIPSGRISVRAARQAAGAHLAGGIAMATCAGVAPGLVAAALVACIVLYDATLKPTVFAPPLMGLCRALNFCLPLAGLGATPGGPGDLLPIAAIWLYVTSLTYFARGEATGRSRGPLMIAAFGMLVSVIGLTALEETLREVHGDFLVGVAILMASCFWGTASAVLRPEPVTMQRAVHRLVLLLVGMDACIAWASRGVGFAAAILFLMAAAAILGSKRIGFRVT